MIAGLQWTEPVAVRQWQTQGMPESKKLLWFFAKWSLLLGSPVLCFVYFAAPGGWKHIAIAFLFMVAAHPLAIVFSVWANRKESIRYSVEFKGLRRVQAVG